MTEPIKPGSPEAFFLQTLVHMGMNEENLIGLALGISVAMQDPFLLIFLERCFDTESYPSTQPLIQQMRENMEKINNAKLQSS